MSFMLTAPQMRARTKTVTRRLGWKTLLAGTRLLAVERCQGIKPGLGHLVEIFGMIEVVSVERWNLWPLNSEEVAREGFPGMSPDDFAIMFCKHHRGCQPETIVTRIEFRHVEGET